MNKSRCNYYSFSHSKQSFILLKKYSGLLLFLLLHISELTANETQSKIPIAVSFTEKNLNCSVKERASGNGKYQKCLPELASKALSNASPSESSSTSNTGTWVVLGGVVGAAALAVANNKRSDNTASNNNKQGLANRATNTNEKESANAADYLTNGYKNRPDLDQIKAKEGYANIANHIANKNTQTGATHGGKGIKIVIMDTGVDTSHQNLRNNIEKNTCNAAQDEECKKHLALTDNSGHGTHVAGIAAGSRLKGTNSMQGVAYNATLIGGCAVVRGGCYRGKKNPSSDGHSLLWAANRGALIMNMSYGLANTGYERRALVARDVAKGYDDPNLKKYLYGSPSNSPDSYYQKVKTALKKGLIAVLGAGNLDEDYPAGAQPGISSTAPLAYKNTPLKNDFAYQWVSVVNVDNNNQLSGSHACGDAADFCLAAPGTRIYSTTPNQKYDRYSGTSMAAPQVSGGLALLAGAFPGLRLPANHPLASICQRGSSNYNSKQCFQQSSS